METSEHGESLLIGKDIKWATIERQYCRIKHFTPFAIVESGEIRGVLKTLPYALLLVECPNMFQEATMPVVHKLDFRNLWTVFMEMQVYGDTQDYGVSSEMEVLVVYAPSERRSLSGLFSGVLPSLVIGLYSKGSLERLYEKPGTTKSASEWFESVRPIFTWDARPEETR